MSPPAFTGWVRAGGSGGRLPHAMLVLCLGGSAALACGVGAVGPGGSPMASSSSGSGQTGAGSSSGASASSSGVSSGSGASAAAGSSASGAGMTSGMTPVTGSRPPLCTTGNNGKPAYPMLRRLSEPEYNRTLIDVFGADPTTWQNIQFVGDIRQAGQYDTYSDALAVNQPWLAALVDATFARAQALLAGPQATSILAPPCVATAIDAACATAVIGNYGYRLYRRPLAASEVADYVGLYTSGLTTLMLSPSDSLAGVLAALMQSPYTLYIHEVGQPSGSSFRLTGYELASVLSYGLTGSAPSKALLDSAGMGGLDAPAGVTAAAQAMIQGPAGQAHLTRFFVEWLAYDGVPYAAKDPMVYTFPNTLANAMVQETQLFIADTTAKGGGVSDLLLSPNTFVNLPLAQFYGWDTTGLTAAQFTSRPRPAGQGLGMLAQGGFLARMATPNSSSPTQRGVFVLRQLLCGNVPPPPANVPVIPAPSGNVTTRARYEMQHAVSSCAVCHSRIDGIGFGLENFDGIGKYRTTEVGQPINASGTIADLGNTTFAGPADLAQKLASAPETAQCFAAQLTSYVLGVSVNDGLCIAPPSAYPTASAPLGFTAVLGQVVEPTHLAVRAP